MISLRAWKILLPSSFLIAINWSIYIFAVNIDRVIETAIGYYLNPLVTILFGVIFFKEKLTKVQMLAVALCFAGLLYFTVNYGSFPWISLGLALSFAAYGVFKKKGGYHPVLALTFENLITFIPAIIVLLIVARVTDDHAFANASHPHMLRTTLLLVLGGLVTAIPLLLFAWAANVVPLSWIGFLQYVSPTIALLLGVFLFDEPFTYAHIVCLILIWTGIALVTGEMFMKTRKTNN
ncbi:MAG: EamA family transporter RarD [Actinomycetaceae bacterium]|nr:EamA family transporter RarD [Actinomycetaceae bacterium]